MHVKNLGPHTFASPPHESHHAWLSRFTPEERHQLIAEDTEARTGITAVLAGAMLFGMVSLIVTLIVCLSMGLM
ncbi:MAG TPA: hypothetical protein VL096_14520 [Pirellulaceae bacterium]|nr:hypothetical protein [Pirellulaceae bacterium]